MPMKTYMTRAAATIAVLLTTSIASADALVFDFSATLKTTVAQTGKVKASTLTCLDESAKIVYRKQGTVKLQGLIWGCECEALAQVTGYTSPTADGCAFWDATNKQLLNGEFSWKVLNRIDSTGKKAEGAWTYESECYNLTGGGFGTIKTTGKGENATFYLSSLSGNLAGWKCAPGQIKKSGTYRPCTFCDAGSEETEESVTAVAWSFCDCSESEDFTAISGTWNLKFNSKATNKLRQTTSIFDAYSFPGYVKNALMSAN